MLRVRDLIEENRGSKKKSFGYDIIGQVVLLFVFKWLRKTVIYHERS